MYRIDGISVESVPSDYRDAIYFRDSEGIIQRLKPFGSVATRISGATERIQTGLFTMKVRIHMSTHVSLAEFKATLNHELIHAYHRTSDLPFLLGRAYHNATEQSAFTYSVRYAPSALRLQNAQDGLLRYKSPYKLGWPKYLIKLIYERIICLFNAIICWPIAWPTDIFEPL